MSLKKMVGKENPKNALIHLSFESFCTSMGNFKLLTNDMIRYQFMISLYPIP